MISEWGWAQPDDFGEMSFAGWVFPGTESELTKVKTELEQDLHELRVGRKEPTDRFWFIHVSGAPLGIPTQQEIDRQKSMSFDDRVFVAGREAAAKREEFN